MLQDRSRHTFNKAPHHDVARGVLITAQDVPAPWLVAFVDVSLPDVHLFAARRAGFGCVRLRIDDELHRHTKRNRTTHTTHQLKTTDQSAKKDKEEMQGTRRDIQNARMRDTRYKVQE